MIDAAFRLPGTAWCCVLRYEVAKLSENDMVQ
jgi:hypothetical protein